MSLGASSMADTYSNYKKNLQVPQKIGNFLTGWAIISFARTLLHVVSCSYTLASHVLASCSDILYLYLWPYYILVCMKVGSVAKRCVGCKCALFCKLWSNCFIPWAHSAEDLVCLVSLVCGQPVGVQPLPAHPVLQEHSEPYTSLLPGK